MGRKYGRLAYGRYSYDLWPVVWIPIPEPPPGEIWVPETGTSPPIEVWLPQVVANTEIWNPKLEPTTTWSPAVFGSVEIWKPVTHPMI